MIELLYTLTLLILIIAAFIGWFALRIRKSIKENKYV